METVPYRYILYRRRYSRKRRILTTTLRTYSNVYVKIIMDYSPNCLGIVTCHIITGLRERDGRMLLLFLFSGGILFCSSTIISETEIWKKIGVKLERYLCIVQHEYLQTHLPFSIDHSAVLYQQDILYRFLRQFYIAVKICKHLVVFEFIILVSFYHYFMVIYRRCLVRWQAATTCCRVQYLLLMFVSNF